MSLSTPSPAWEQVEEQFVMTKAGSVEGAVGVITHRYYDADLVDAARAADASQIEERGELLQTIGAACGFPRVLDLPQLAETVVKAIQRRDREVAALSAQVQPLEQQLKAVGPLCERCGGTGQQVAGLWTGSAYDSEAGACDDCHGVGRLSELSELRAQVEQLTQEKDKLKALVLKECEMHGCASCFAEVNAQLRQQGAEKEKA